MVFLCRKIVDGHTLAAAATVKEATAAAGAEVNRKLCSSVYSVFRFVLYRSLLSLCNRQFFFLLILLHRCMPPLPSKLVPSQRVPGLICPEKKNNSFRGFPTQFLLLSFRCRSYRVAITLHITLNMSVPGACAPPAPISKLIKSEATRRRRTTATAKQYACNTQNRR